MRVAGSHRATPAICRVQDHRIRCGVRARSWASVMIRKLRTLIAAGERHVLPKRPEAISPGATQLRRAACPCCLLHS